MNPHIHKTVTAFLSASALALTMASCGGGGGESFAGIDRLGASTGTITGFGSIFVNGVEWRTSGAAISIDDNPGTESQLRIGQVVTVRGEFDADGLGGVADSVEFDNEVKGPIAAIDLAAGRFLVLGLAVFVSPDTAFDDSIPAGIDGRRDLADLAVGDVVEVSGYRDAGGAIRATRVGLRGAGGTDEIKGVVSNLNTGAATFQLGSLVVNYLGATLEDFGSDTLSNGDQVEAKGSLNAGVLDAVTIEREDGFSGEADEEGEVEGYVTRFVSATDFDVAGVRVTTSSATEFEGGTAGDLGLNVKVEVEGEFNASGALVAEKVDFRVQPEDASVEVAGNVATVDAATGIVTLQGVNIAIRVDAATQVEDESNADVADFALANLFSGDYIEVRGASDAGTLAVNDMIATRLERRNSDDEFVLRGPVQAVNQPDLSILGVQVATDFAEFRGLDEQPISEAAFFLAIGPGDVVKVRTTLDQVGINILLAAEAEIEELN